MTHETDCDICAACARRNITDEMQIDYIHQYVEAEANLIDIIANAEDAGIDLDDPVVTEISDEIFGATCLPSELN
jgi:hypothetical protein